MVRQFTITGLGRTKAEIPFQNMQAYILTERKHILTILAEQKKAAGKELMY